LLEKNWDVLEDMDLWVEDPERAQFFGEKLMVLQPALGVCFSSSDIL
jgi:hypothetical protein